MQKIEEFLMIQREMFAEEEVKTSFSKLISFVLQVKNKILTTNL